VTDRRTDGHAAYCLSGALAQLSATKIHSVMMDWPQKIHFISVWPPGSADTVCPRPFVTPTFDRLIVKLVCESHPRWGTFIPNLGTLGLWVLELFAMYATDGQTDRHTDRRTDGKTDGQTKATLTAPFPTVDGSLSVYRAQLLLFNRINPNLTFKKNRQKILKAKFRKLFQSFVRIGT